MPDPSRELRKKSLSILISTVRIKSRYDSQKLRPIIMDTVVSSPGWKTLLADEMSGGFVFKNIRILFSMCDLKLLSE